MFGFGTEISTSSIYVDGLFTCFPSIKLMLSVCVHLFDFDLWLFCVECGLKKSVFLAFNVFVNTLFITCLSLIY